MARSLLIPIQENWRKTEAGYALTEVLIAAAIIAGVIGVTATGISTSLRGATATSARAEILTEAVNITARLEAGVSKGDLLKGYQNWTLAYVHTSSIEATSPQTLLPVRVVLRRTSGIPYEISTVIFLTRRELEQRQS